MFWSIFLNSLALIVGILIAGWVIDKVVRGFSSKNSASHKADRS